MKKQQDWLYSRFLIFDVKIFCLQVFRITLELLKWKTNYQRSAVVPFLTTARWQLLIFVRKTGNELSEFSGGALLTTAWWSLRKFALKVATYFTSRGGKWKEILLRRIVAKVHSAAESNCCSFYYDLSLNNSLQNTDLCKNYFFLNQMDYEKKERTEKW